MSTAIWCSSLTVASITGVSRIFAGRHYTTDVLTGVVAGTLIGFIVPQLHKVQTPITLSADGETITVGLSF